jgi:hypothetical protein
MIQSENWLNAIGMMQRYTHRLRSKELLRYVQYVWQRYSYQNIAPLIFSSKPIVRLPPHHPLVSCQLYSSIRNGPPRCLVEQQ